MQGVSSLSCDLPHLGETKGYMELHVCSELAGPTVYDSILCTAEFGEALSGVACIPQGPQDGPIA